MWGGVLIGPGMVDANVKSNIACSLRDCQWQSLVGKEWVGYWWLCIYILFKTDVLQWVNIPILKVYLFYGHVSLKPMQIWPYIQKRNFGTSYTKLMNWEI